MLRGRLDAVRTGGGSDAQMGVEKEVLQQQNGRLAQENKQLKEGGSSGAG